MIIKHYLIKINLFLSTEYFVLKNIITSRLDNPVALFKEESNNLVKVTLNR